MRPTTAAWYNQRTLRLRIECFHSRGQHLCKFIGTKECVCVRKEFNSQRISLGHQHGRRDVMWKHSRWCLNIQPKRSPFSFRYLICRFLDDLKYIALTILDRNKKRQVVYEYLNPSRNSKWIHILKYGPTYNNISKEVRHHKNSNFWNYGLSWHIQKKNNWKSP